MIIVGVVRSVVLRFRGMPKKRFSANMAFVEPFRTDCTDIGMTTREDHRLTFFQVKLLNAYCTMQIHFNSFKSLKFRSPIESRSMISAKGSFLTAGSLWAGVWLGSGLSLGLVYRRSP